LQRDERRDERREVGAEQGTADGAAPIASAYGAGGDRAKAVDVRLSPPAAGRWGRVEHRLYRLYSSS
jgi:hypothetical protein